jgi:3'-phosphoadenosine 5'-phosphosulfate sulfotransferase (PAPS reductase)/FAD synthetase
MWWCNECGEKSQLNISRNRFLKEFIIQNPPDFLISDQCCNGAKKKTSYKIEKEIQPDLHIIGVRKAEGGVRASAYKTCFDDNRGGCSYLRPVFWFKLSDKAAYDEAFEITHSECYTKYGFKRTGCACCPYGHDFEKELECAKEFEPKLFQAANGVFGAAYDYVRKYREFYKQMLES